MVTQCRLTDIDWSECNLHVNEPYYDPAEWQESPQNGNVDVLGGKEVNGFVKHIGKVEEEDSYEQVVEK